MGIRGGREKTLDVGDTAVNTPSFVAEPRVEDAALTVDPVRHMTYLPLNAHSRKVQLGDVLSLPIIGTTRLAILVRDLKHGVCF